MHVDVYLYIFAFYAVERVEEIYRGVEIRHHYSYLKREGMNFTSREWGSPSISKSATGESGCKVTTLDAENCIQKCLFRSVILLTVHNQENGGSVLPANN